MTIGDLPKVERGVEPSIPRAEAEDYQRRILPGVSRTFALTIPELPAPLVDVVANGYLLCRIADTIQDEPALTPKERAHWHAAFVDVLRKRGDAKRFAESLAAQLSERTLPAERELVRNAATIVSLTHSFPSAAASALVRCVEIMCQGMVRHAVPRDALGLANTADLDDYCYHVAGVVGEMLTDLFCDYSPQIAKKRDLLKPRAVVFGRGLQLTNILKDIWEDLEQDDCWLPRDLFDAGGFDLDELRTLKASGSTRSKEFESGLGQLLAIARHDLRVALEYTLLLPRAETGLRRFCLWAIGMAILTLRRIDRRRGFRTAQEVKISRRAVRATAAVSALAAKNDRTLRLLFSTVSVGLPRAAAIEALKADLESR